MIKRLILSWLLPPLEEPKPVISKAELELRNELNRLKMVEKFQKLAGKAEEIELEWQRIQQNEHDALYAFQSTLEEANKQDYWYKKGIAEGIKWCVERFT